MLFVSQTNPHGCGFACLKIVLANLNHDPNYLYLNDDLDTRLWSLKDIISRASLHNLYLVGFEIEHKDELLKYDKFPIFAVMYNQSHQLHCVIIHSIKKNRVKIVDPDLGIYSLPFNKFKESFTGKGLLIKDFSISKCEPIVTNPIKKKDHFLNGFIQVLGACCLAMGLFYLDNKTQPYVSLGLLFFFFVFEMLMRHHNFALMKKLDDYYINDNNFTIKNYPLYLKRYELYKKDLLANPMSLILALFVCIFIIFVTVLNNVINLVLIIMPFLLSIVDVFLIKPWSKRRENNVRTIEDSLENVNDKMDFKEKANTIHQLSYDYGKVELVKKYFYIFLMISSSILAMFMQKSIILPYLVFYVTVQYLFMENLTSLLSYSNNRLELVKKKAMLVDCIAVEKY